MNRGCRNQERGFRGERRAEDREDVTESCERRPDDCEGATLNRKRRFREQNASYSIQNVAFSSAKARLSILSGASSSKKASSTAAVTVSRFIGRGRRFQASRLLRK